MNKQNYQICTKTIMDTTDPDIHFDESGVSNHWFEYKEKEKKVLALSQTKDSLKKLIDKIKDISKDSKYDCLIGVSGGLDSSYLVHMAVSHGLKPLVVHFDNGWNSELAVKNIEQLIKGLNVDLYTYVMDWNEFRDMQRAYFKASVLDLEVPTDHMIFGALYKVAAEFKIKVILNGSNIVTEGVLPDKWRYTKNDYTNMKNIHNKFGEVKIKHLPKLGLFDFIYFTKIKKIVNYDFLNYIDYNVVESKRILKDKYDWKDYGGKHFESVFTRFYQGYILPHKFNIDKRRAHLSSLICSGQITREEALEEISKPAYPEALQKDDKIYVAKKLGFGLSDFEKLLQLPNINHEYYGTDKKIRALVFKLNKLIRGY